MTAQTPLSRPRVGWMGWLRSKSTVPVAPRCGPDEVVFETRFHGGGDAGLLIVMRICIYFDPSVKMYGRSAVFDLGGTVTRKSDNCFYADRQEAETMARRRGEKLLAELEADLPGVAVG